MSRLINYTLKMASSHLVGISREKNYDKRN